MYTRRKFLFETGALAAGGILLPKFMKQPRKLKNIGVQLYTFRKELAADAIGTLRQIAGLGFTEIESARSDKGHYYGLSAKEMKKLCSDLGMTLRSGHVHIDDTWKQTLDEAAESGQEYLICSTMPTEGQTVDNYKRVADRFNQAGEDCKKLGIKFGYHNHGYEFDQVDGKVLYDVLLDNTSAQIVHMEMDLGWVVMAGKDPLDYFRRYSGRFPLWHLKDMDPSKKESTEFGKGTLNIAKMLDNQAASGLKYPFIEQEEYSNTPLESMKFNLQYLKDLK
jgi:sugar phosphate isomerase/epimerase